MSEKLPSVPVAPEASKEVEKTSIELTPEKIKKDLLEVARDMISGVGLLKGKTLEEKDFKVEPSGKGLKISIDTPKIGIMTFHIEVELTASRGKFKADISEPKSGMVKGAIEPHIERMPDLLKEKLSKGYGKIQGLSFSEGGILQVKVAGEDIPKPKVKAPRPPRAAKVTATPVPEAIPATTIETPIVPPVENNVVVPVSEPASLPAPSFRISGGQVIEEPPSVAPETNTTRAVLPEIDPETIRMIESMTGGPEGNPRGAETAALYSRYLEGRNSQIGARAEKYGEKILNIVRTAGERYKKIPRSRKYIIAGALVAGGLTSAAIGGASGAVLASVLFLGKASYRFAGASAMFVGVEHALETWKKKENKGRFAEFITRHPTAYAAVAGALVLSGLPGSAAGKLIRGGAGLVSEAMGVPNPIEVIGSLIKGAAKTAYESSPVEAIRNVIGGHISTPSGEGVHAPEVISKVISQASKVEGPKIIEDLDRPGILTADGPHKLWPDLHNAEAPLKPIIHPTADGPHKLWPESSGNLEGAPMNMILEVPKGGNLWDMLKAHEITAGLSDQKKNYVIASIEREIANMKEEELRKMGFTGKNIDIGVVHEGQKLDLSKILGDKEKMDSILGRADRVAASLPPKELPLQEHTFEPAKVSIPQEYPRVQADIEYNHHPEASQNTFRSTWTWDNTNKPPLERHYSGFSGLGHDSEYYDNFSEISSSNSPLVRIWEMQHPGEVPSRSVLDQLAEMRAHNVPLEAYAPFQREVQYRMERMLYDVYGPDPLHSAEWNTWQKYGALEVMKMPDSEMSVGHGKALKEYMRILMDKAEAAGLPRPEPQVRGGIPEETGKFISRLEAMILRESLTAGIKG